MTQLYHAEEPHQPRHHKKFPPAKPGHKWCNACEKELPHDAYRINTNGKPHSVCRDCERQWRHARTQPYEIEPRHNPRHTLHLISTREGYRYCNACGKEKPFEEFHSRNGKPIGTCIECERTHDRERNKLRSPRQNPPLPKATKPGYKVCNTCFKEKPYKDFNKDTAQSDDHRGCCRECESELYNNASDEEKEQRKAIRKVSEDARREDIRERDRARSQTEEHRSKRREREANKKMLDPAYRQAVREGMAEWKKKNPLYARESNARHKIKQQEARAGRVDYQYVLERDGMWCHICQMDIEAHPTDEKASLSFDHVVPLHPRKGEPKGTHTEDNLKPSHLICNNRKKNRPMWALRDFDKRGPYID